MSRIGLKPIELPAGVEVRVDDDNLVTVKGPKGELQENISSLIDVEIKDGIINVSRDGDQKEKRSQHGLARTLINNMVVGVTEGYQKKLQLEGVGYRAKKKGKTLVMNLGYDFKFGINMEREQEIAELISKTYDSDTVRFTGFHSHIGSQIFEPLAFTKAAEALFGFMRRMKDNYR